MQTQAQHLQEGSARVKVMQKAMITLSKQRASQHTRLTMQQQQEQQQCKRQVWAGHSSLPGSKLHSRASSPPARYSMAVTGQRWMKWKRVVKVLQ